MALAAGILAVLAGSAVQSALGFGFAMLAAPVLATTLEPRAAVASLAVLALVANGLTLGTERRRPMLLPSTAPLAAATVPGVALGLLALTLAAKGALRILVSLVVFLAVGLEARRRFARPADAALPAPPTRGGGRLGPAAAGLLSGATTSSTGISGPPVVLYLLRQGVEPAPMRDTLAALFIVQALLTLAGAGLAGALELPSSLPILVAVTVAGQVLGRGAFRHVAHHHDVASLVVLTAGTLAGLAPALSVVL